MAKTHGLTGTKVYNVWRTMLARCHNTKQKDYKNYGGRGIHVCERWFKFENFLEDMGQPPTGYTIERRDNNGHYEPSNCEWIPRAMQNANNRRTVRITFNGKLVNPTELGKLLGIKPHTIRARIRRGLNEDKLFSPNLMR